MALYPNILFHFTKMNGLYEILSSTFKVSYARERILGGNKIKEFAVPMVSFSDLRLSELKDISQNTLGFVPIAQIQTVQQKSKFNQKVKHLRLSFQPDDIQYIIVEKDQDINNLINHLRRVKGRFSTKTVDRLASRILTYNQIENDV